jgi:D-arabinose 1-dehydrogenase-like Zn-dependent alcohol dehydrogenase
MAAKSRSATSSAQTNPSVSRTGFAGDASSGKLMNVGFIGLGHMGAGMAANLLKAGHRVTVFNRTPSKAEVLITQGATLATSIAEASHGDAVVTMLANDAAVEDVVLGRDGVIANLPSGGLHVSSSTISVALSERLTEAHTRKNQRFVAAPVFGRPDVRRRVGFSSLLAAMLPQSKLPHHCSMRLGKARL